MGNFQSNALADIGGEPLDGSGLENEKSAFEEEISFQTLSPDQEAEDK